MNTTLPAFPPDDQYGRRTIPGMAPHVSARFRRKIAHGRVEYFHRAKNGISDPLTYFHIVDVLLELLPGQTWRTADLVGYLNYHRDQLVWDPYTVGRVVNDIADNLNETYKPQPIDRTRRYNGMMFHVTPTLQTRIALKRLLEDLVTVADKWIEAEKAGKAPARNDSPLLSCPSVMGG